MRESLLCLAMALSIRDEKESVCVCVREVLYVEENKSRAHEKRG